MHKLARSLLCSHLVLRVLGVLDVEGGAAGVTLPGHGLGVVILEPALLRWLLRVVHEALVDQDVVTFHFSW